MYNEIILKIMELREQILREFSENAGELVNKRGLVGFDGELGPVICDGFMAMGLEMRYIGALGGKDVDDGFKDFAKRTGAYSLCKRGELGLVNFERIMEVVGEGIFIDAITRADLIGFVNWAGVPHLNSILIKIVDKLLPSYGPREGRVFLFDLGDLLGGWGGDLEILFSIIKLYQNNGNVVMAVTSDEAVRICQSLGSGGKAIREITRENAQEVVSYLTQRLEISMMGIYDKRFSVCATHRDHYIMERELHGLKECEPIGGLYFKVGLAIGNLLNLSPMVTLGIGEAMLEFYLGRKRGPTLAELVEFIAVSY